MQLPTDILKEIFQHCDNIEFYNIFVRTNKLFKNVISIDKLIRLKFGEYNDYSLYYVLVKSLYFNWKNGYKYIFNNYNVLELLTKYNTYCNNHEEITVNIFGDIKIEINIENKYSDFTYFKNTPIFKILLAIYVYKNNDMNDVFDYIYDNNLYYNDDIKYYIDYYIEKLNKLNELYYRNNSFKLDLYKSFINIVRNKKLDKLVEYTKYGYKRVSNIFNRKILHDKNIFNIHLLNDENININISNNISNRMFQDLIITTYILNKEYKTVEYYLKLIMPNKITNIIERIYYLNDDNILKYIFVHTEMKTFYEIWNVDYNIEYNNENDLIRYFKFLDYCKNYAKYKNSSHLIRIN